MSKVEFQILHLKTPSCLPVVIKMAGKRYSHVCEWKIEVSWEIFCTIVFHFLRNLYTKYIFTETAHGLMGNPRVPEPGIESQSLLPLPLDQGDTLWNPIVPEAWGNYGKIPCLQVYANCQIGYWLNCLANIGKL